MQYINYYSDYISFAIHTGDYCGNTQQSYTDFYADATKCARPIYNCVGNHDTVEMGANGERIKGTRTYDAFNVMSVDVNLGILKLVRVGNNVDHYLRIKRTLCYDYINKKVIFCS